MWWVRAPGYTWTSSVSSAKQPCRVLILFSFICRCTAFTRAGTWGKINKKILNSTRVHGELTNVHSSPRTSSILTHSRQMLSHQDGRNVYELVCSFVCLFLQIVQRYDFHLVKLIMLKYNFCWINSLNTF